MFQPNIIIDAKFGYMWFLQLKLDHIDEQITNVPILIDFLILRKNSKQSILNVCRNVVAISRAHKQNVIGNVALLFNKLNMAYKESWNSVEPTNLSQDTFSYLKHKIAITIDQKDVLTHFFEMFQEDCVGPSLAIAIIFEYINSLVMHKIPVEYFIYEFLIDCLIKTGNYYQMQQFLQYHVFSDSKPLACQLLSLNNQYPYAIQLGLDMLKRIAIGDEEIVEVLLSQNQVIRALDYVAKHMDINSISARKFLEAAKNTNDLSVFHQVYKTLQLRNVRLRKFPDFVKGENCEQYERYFESHFGSKLSLCRFEW